MWCSKEHSNNYRDCDDCKYRFQCYTKSDKRDWIISLREELIRPTPNKGLDKQIKL